MRATDLSFSRRDLNRSTTEALQEKVMFDQYLNQVCAWSPNTKWDEHGSEPTRNIHINGINNLCKKE